MKAFFNKIKRSNKVYLTLFIISFILYLASYIYLTINLIHLSGIETIIRYLVIVFFGLYTIIWLLIGLVTLFTKQYGKFIGTYIFTVLFTLLFGFASYFIDTIYKELDSISKDTITYTSDLITLNDTILDNSSIIGMINDPTDIESYQLAKKIIENNNLNYQINSYDDFFEMLNDLYNKKIAGAFVSSNYSIIFSPDERFSNIANEVKVVYSYSENMANQDNTLASNKKLTEPFTILLMGVDSESDGLQANQAFNGDTLMLVTFNPKTLTASMFSVPRDLYVPISCRNGAYAKINSSAARGTSCVIDTLQDLTGVNVDYYVKINFKGVVDLVNALGGVTVNVEKPYFTYNNGIDYHGQVCEQNSDRDFGSNMVCMDPGEQVLNGEQALAYARNRHQYIGSDLDRIKHQQEVVEAIANESKHITSFDQFKDILNAVQKNINTNMSTEQILSLYSVGKSIIMNTLNGNVVNLSINKTYLETFSLPVYVDGSTTSALGYYSSSLNDITEMMKVNLEVETPTPNTSFTIDYNENYTTKYYGKGFYTGKNTETMPNLIGSSKEYAVNWASSHNLHLSIVTLSGSDFNTNYGSGIVVNQSVTINTLIANVSELTIYINGEANQTTSPNSTTQTPSNPSSSSSSNTGNTSSITNNNTSTSTTNPTTENSTTTTDQTKKSTDTIINNNE